MTSKRAHPVFPGVSAPVVAVLLTVAVLYFAREVFIPLALSILFSFLLSPLAKRLQTWRLGRVPSVVIVLLGALLSAGLIAWMVSNQLIDVINQLPTYEGNIRQKLATVSKGRFTGLARFRNSVDELGKELESSPDSTSAAPSPTPRGSISKPPSGAKPARPIAVEVVAAPTNMLQAAGGILGPLLVPLATTIVVIVFTAFILLNDADLRNRLIRLTAPGQINMMTQALDEASARVSRYLVMQFFVNCAFGTLIGLTLFFVGLPSALLLGVLAGLLRFVPYLGSTIGGALPVILALAVFPGWRQPLITLGLIIVIELVTANVIEPLAYGSRTGISPLAILVAAVFWTTLWGPLGLILSTPLTVCVVVLGRYVPHLEFLNVLLGDEPVLPPEAHFYQRLLAMDRHDARILLSEFLKDHEPVALYDLMILPALVMAEEDRHKGALNPAHEEFVIQCVSEFVLDVPQIRGEVASSSKTEAADDLGLEKAPGPSRAVLCLSAGDRADEIGAAMLAQLLEQAGHRVTSLSVAESRSVADASGSNGHSIDLIVISALPPFAILSARSLAKRLRTRFPQTDILVGLWQLGSESKGGMARLEKAFTDPVVTTLAEALAMVDGATSEQQRQNGISLVSNTNGSNTTAEPPVREEAAPRVT